MRTNRRLIFFSTLAVVLSSSGCGGGGGGSPAPGVSYFIVNPIYGAPGATVTDTQTLLSGIAPEGAPCSGQPNCPVSFQNEYAAVNINNPGLDGYTESTNAVGGVTWNFTGNPSPNCAAGYSDNEASVSAQLTYSILCQSPTTDFTASPGGWVVGHAPPTVTFTAALNTFPTNQYAAATTVYSTAEAVQWQGTLTSASVRQIIVPVNNTALGTHVVIFRNPSTNAVIGAGAYVVYPPPPPLPCEAVPAHGSTAPLARPICP